MFKNIFEGTIVDGNSGQDGLEYVALAAIILVVLVIVGRLIAQQLQAAREAIAPGTGFALVADSRVPGQLQAGFADSITNNFSGRTGRVFSVQGYFHIPLNPLGFSLDADVSSGALVPEWEFIP